MKTEEELESQIFDQLDYTECYLADDILNIIKAGGPLITK